MWEAVSTASPPVLAPDQDHSRVHDQDPTFVQVWPAGWVVILSIGEAPPWCMCAKADGLVAPGIGSVAPDLACS